MKLSNFNSKKVFILLLILGAVLGNLSYKQYKEQKVVQTEKEILKNQAENLQKKNNDLSKSLAYLNSPDYKETVARQQLNMKKSGEEVFTFGEKIENSPNSASVLGTNTKKSNFEKWLNYFTNTK